MSLNSLERTLRRPRSNGLKRGDSRSPTPTVRQPHGLTLDLTSPTGGGDSPYLEATTNGGDYSPYGVAKTTPSPRSDTQTPLVRQPSVGDTTEMSSTPPESSLDQPIVRARSNGIRRGDPRAPRPLVRPSHSLRLSAPPLNVGGGSSPYLESTTTGGYSPYGVGTPQTEPHPEPLGLPLNTETIEQNVIGTNGPLDMNETPSTGPTSSSSDQYLETDYNVSDKTTGGGSSSEQYLETDYNVSDKTTGGGSSSEQYLETDYNVSDSVGGTKTGGPSTSTVPEVEQRKELTPQEKDDLSRSQWHEDVRNRTTLPTISLDPHYRGEQTNQQSGDLAGTVNEHRMTGTHYASSPEEFRTDIVNGSLVRGGQTVDSSNNKRIYNKDRSGRSNFALDGAGGFYSSDVRTEINKRFATVNGEKVGQRHNHSSLVGGGDVAAAGTMAVKNGRVTSLSDDSGHYKPNMTQTYEAVKHLRNHGVMDDKAQVQLSGKRVQEKMFNSTVQEFMRYEDLILRSREKAKKENKPQHLNRPEQALRKELGARRSLEEQLKSRSFATKMQSASTEQRRMKKLTKRETKLAEKRTAHLKELWRTRHEPTEPLGTEIDPTQLAPQTNPTPVVETLPLTSMQEVPSTTSPSTTSPSTGPQSTDDTATEDTATEDKPTGSGQISDYLTTDYNTTDYNTTDYGQSSGYLTTDYNVKKN